MFWTLTVGYLPTFTVVSVLGMWNSWSFWVCVLAIWFGGALATLIYAGIQAMKRYDTGQPDRMARRPMANQASWAYAKQARKY